MSRRIVGSKTILLFQLVRASVYYTVNPNLIVSPFSAVSSALRLWHLREIPRHCRKTSFEAQVFSRVGLVIAYRYSVFFTKYKL